MGRKIRMDSLLDRNITRFVKKFGVRRAFQNRLGNFYYPKDRLIGYNLREWPEDKPHLIEYYNKTYNIDIVPWYFIFILLHEVGHHKTLCQLSEQEKDEEIKIKEFLRIDKSFSKEEQDILYCKLKAERLATEWAINYIDTHWEECWKAQRQFYKCARHLANKNRLY